MIPARRILVVTRDSWREQALPVWLSTAGYDVDLVGTFAEAKTHLDDRPDAVVTDVKLGAYNGLHLAVRAHELSIPVILVGLDDAVLEREASALNTRWLGATPTREALVSEIAQATSNAASGGDAPRGSGSSFPWMVFGREGTPTDARKPVLH